MPSSSIILSLKLVHINVMETTRGESKQRNSKLKIRKRMGLLLFLPIFLLSILSNSPILSHGWGKEGHIMVCKIAKDYFTQKTAKAVVDLLPEVAEGELWSVCPWADDVRFQYRWSIPLHYVNTPGVCGYKYSRDCHNSKGEKGMCVVGAINNYTDQLRSYGDSSSAYNLTESLMFLAHFVGDVHQPLHAGFKEDSGGNSIDVNWDYIYHRKTNLHHLWDTDMIETAMKAYYDRDIDAMTERIQMNITDDQVDSWENCDNKVATCANDYAVESSHLACNYAYKDVEQNATIGEDYFLTRIPIVEKRIAQAGVRLGLILNRIFDEPAQESIQSS